MKRSTLFIYMGLAAMALGMSIMITSCQKRTKDDTEETGYATEHAVSEKSYNDVESIADQASTVATGGSLSYKGTGITSACATVTRASGVITVDFGSVNCRCNDDRYRRGKIIINYTGAYADSGSVHTITFDNFYQNDNKIEGTKTVTNMGHNSLGQPYFDVSVAGTITLASTGGVITTASHRTRTWIEGYTTPSDFSDDKYSLTGTGSITRPNGTTINVTVSNLSPLIIAAGCQWIEAGTITFALPSGLTRSINYGTAANCDNQAVLSLPSGATYNITLP